MKNQEKSALAIVKSLIKEGFEAYYAGGYVRDYLLKIQVKDIDICTNATPLQIKKLFPKTIAVGEAFGVIVVIHNKCEFDVATFRKDMDYKDGRRPESVVFTSAKEDVLRRDFTINGMLFDPLTSKIIDLVQGKKDLKKNIIRCIGDANLRFREDHLRMLRAIRFASRLNFEIEKKTFEAIKKNKAKLAKISIERIKEELNKILLSPNTDRAIRLLFKSELLKIIFPEAKKLHDHKNKSIVMTVNAVKFIPSTASKNLAWSTLLLFLDIINIEKILKRFKFSAKDRLVITSMINDIDYLDRARELNIYELKRLIRSELFNDKLKLYEIYCIANKNNLDQYHFLNKKIKEYSKKDLFPKLYITGELLIKKGLKPGPKFKKILAHFEDLQLSGELKNSRKAIKELQNYLT